MMKKILVLMVAVFAMTMTASAQKITKEQRNQVIENLIGRMKPVDGSSWLITTEPISYYEYWVVTGKKKHDARTSVSNAAKVTQAEKESFVLALNQEAKRPIFSLPTRAEIQLAHKKVGLHGDLTQLSSATTGCFWIKISKKMYKELTE
jgi:hypothetical protein